MQTIKYKNITIDYDDMAVHVHDDQFLRDFLAQPENGSVELTTAIKAQYHQLFNKELAIDDDSLAIEILGHVYASKLFDLIDKASDILPESIKETAQGVVDKMQTYTDVIDIGEAAVDGNRKVWDALVPAKKIIYKLIGDNA